ncbi:MAG: hypothetical protein ACUVWO_09865 [Thermodesulfobacteriota bacterium]
MFLIEGDFARFLDRLGRIHERYGILIHSCVLMTNHDIFLKLLGET